MGSPHPQPDSAAPGRSDASGTARRVVLGCLLGNVIWPIIIPLRLSEPPNGAGRLVYIAGLLLVAAAMGRVMYGAVADWVSPRARRLDATAAVIVTLGLWLPSYAWELPGHSPWAWLAGLMAGALAIAWRWVHAAAVTSCFTAAAVAGALLYDSSVWQNVVTVWGAAAAVVFMSHVLVWLLHLLEQAERSREVTAELALAEERLRIGRELHDVLGHRLAVIALKAEVAGELSQTDHERVREENEAIRQIAITTLGEVRRALVGETVSGLPDQLQSARLVLESAGVELTASTQDVPLSPDESRLLAAVLREGITNALRHARPTRASVTLAQSSACRRFELITESDADSEQPTEDSPRRRTGLQGLATRCAQLGATLEWGPLSDRRYALTVTLQR